MGKFTLSFAPGLLCIFIAFLPLSMSLEWVLNRLMSPVYAFTVIHLMLVPFCLTTRRFMWLLITFLHGLAHQIHPAFVGVIYNTNYTPLYDFVVHASQCLCIFYYSRKLFPIGVMTHSILMCGSLLAHLDNTFMGNPFWLFVSGCGVFGVHWHMMLLNENKNSAVFWTSIFVWFAPYLGYLDFSFIPVWDSMVNSVSLFSMWFFNWFFAYYAYKSTVKN